MYFLDLDGFDVIGSSPEILVRLEGGLVTVRPIAGTAQPRRKIKRWRQNCWPIRKRLPST